MKTRFRTIGDVTDFLDRIPKFSQSGPDAARFGLDRMVQFCSMTGHPENSVRMIHVAGTNGKGTTCQMLASVFQEAGYRTGLYTSPHLVDFSERVRVNSRSIPNEEMLEFFTRNEDALDRVSLTYFEISTCLAFWYFSKAACDVAVIETGLGGRLDATNIIDPMVSVITTVSKDHMDILGGTVQEIAREKAGIIKPGRPVVTGNIGEEALEEVKKAANDCGSKLYMAADCRPEWKDDTVIELTDPKTGKKTVIDGSGRKRVDKFNIAASYRVIHALKKEFPQIDRYFKKGIESVDRRFPDHAHFQKLHPERRWYFDGAHNQEAVTSLMEQVGMIGNNVNPVFILSLMKDKISRELLENFRPYEYVYYIERGIERHASCDQIRSILPQAQCINSNSPEWVRLLNRLKSELVIFAGSFYFYQQVKHWMASQPPSDHKKNPGLRP